MFKMRREFRWVIAPVAVGAVLIFMLNQFKPDIVDISTLSFVARNFLPVIAVIALIGYFLVMLSLSFGSAGRLARILMLLFTLGALITAILAIPALLFQG